ncbi:MAG TPA: hypothetical protein VN775_07115 [Opitutaceae bacterium]|nr:hypothetical protein [Opitutaceae bacterium]
MNRIALLALAGLALTAPGKAAPRPTPAPTPTEEEGTVSGTPVARSQGGWLGVEVTDRTFKITFYNEKKKPVPADVSSAVLRWPVHYQPNDERTQLLPTDDPAVLASPYAVKGPLAFKLRITLLTEGKPDAVETYVIDFRG